SLSPQAGRAEKEKRPRSRLAVRAFVVSSRRRACLLAGDHPLHDPSHALRRGIDRQSNTPGIWSGPADFLDALQNLLLLVESDAEIGMQALVDLRITKREIAHMLPVVDADVVIDRRDEVAGEYPQARAAIFGIGDSAGLGAAEIDHRDAGRLIVVIVPAI